LDLKKRHRDVGPQVDAGLPDRHSTACPFGGSITAGAWIASLSAIAARMVSTGVPEKEAI